MDKDQVTEFEKLELIKILIEHKRKIDIFHEKFDELFGVQNGFPGSSEGHYKVFDEVFRDYSYMVAERIGETKEGIDWFIYENDCGSKGARAGNDAEMIEIRTAEDYLKFINLIAF